MGLADLLFRMAIICGPYCTRDVENVIHKDSHGPHGEGCGINSSLCCCKADTTPVGFKAGVKECGEMGDNRTYHCLPRVEGDQSGSEPDWQGPHLPGPLQLVPWPEEPAECAARAPCLQSAPLSLHTFT